MTQCTRYTELWIDICFHLDYIFLFLQLSTAYFSKTVLNNIDHQQLGWGSCGSEGRATEPGVQVCVHLCAKNTYVHEVCSKKAI